MNNILQQDKLTLSERFLFAAAGLNASGALLILIGAFLHMPWLVGGGLAVCVCIEIRKRRLLPRPTSGIHGTARLADDVDIEAAGLAGSDGLIVGVLPQRSSRRQWPPAIEMLFVPKKQVARMRALMARYVARRSSLASPEFIRVPPSGSHAHTACYMSTGVGKTWRVVIPNLLCDPDNCVVYDPSGETYRETAAYRRQRFGHEIHLIDPFGVAGERETDRLNVLDLVKAGDPGCFDYANHLGHALVVEKPNSHQDPFWHTGTVSGATFLLHTLMLRGGERHGNLLSLGELISATKFRELCESLMDHPDSGLRRRAQQLLNFKGKTYDSLLACLSAEFGWLDSPSFGDVLSGSTFSVRDLFQRQVTLYIAIPGHRAQEAQAFSRAILTAILFAGFDAGPDIHRPPVRLYLDEIATLGRLDILNTLWTQGRKFGFRSVNFLQSVSQVAEIVGTPERINTFRAQMTGGELFKPSDLPTSKEVAEWIGNTTVQTVSTSSQVGTNGGWSSSQGTHPSQGRSGGWSESTSNTVSETGVPVIRPEEILQLGQREALFLSPGTPAVRLNILSEDDVRRCAEPAGITDPKSYLRRVRWYAAVIFFCLGLPGYFGGLFLVATGADRWSHPAAAVKTVPEQWRQPVAPGQAQVPHARGGRRR